MNNDIYAEWLVKRKNPGYRVPVLILFVLLFILGIYATAKSSWGFLVLVVAVFGGAYFIRFLKIEYEYVFVTSELSVDKIYSQQIRKTAVKIDMSDVESVEPSDKQRNALAREDKSLKYEDFTSHEKEGGKKYTILYSKGANRHLLEFEPDEKILKAMWRCSPSKVHIG